MIFDVIWYLGVRGNLYLKMEGGCDMIYYINLAKE